MKKIVFSVCFFSLMSVLSVECMKRGDCSCGCLVPLKKISGPVLSQIDEDMGFIVGRLGEEIPEGFVARPRSSFLLPFVSMRKRPLAHNNQSVKPEKEISDYVSDLCFDFFERMVIEPLNLGFKDLLFALKIKKPANEKEMREFRKRSLLKSLVCCSHGGSFLVLNKFLSEEEKAERKG